MASQANDGTADNGAELIVQKFSQMETAAQPKWLLPVRKSGLARFAELGFPTLRDEDWRFTNVAPIAKLNFQPASPVAVNGAETKVLSESAFTNLSGTRLVFVNGFFSEKLSSLEKIPNGVRIENLAAAVGRASSLSPSEKNEKPGTDKMSILLEKYLGKLAQTVGNSFAALNQAFFTDGAFIFIPQGAEVAGPIQLIYISSAKSSGEMISPRNLIIAGANSKATIVESYLSASDAVYFTNAVTEIVADENAFVEHVKVQDEFSGAFHVATIAGEFGKASNVNIHSFALGAKLSRNNIRAKLAGENLECVLNGLYLTRNEQLADHHMIVEHAQPHCASHEYFNGILDDQSRGVFHGRIYVHSIAQKTDAKQTNKNLLLSDDATADTKPQLEIYADDVKCTHGATVGQLNPESIFYLRSRGMSADTARRMLVHAFAGEIVERVKCEPVRAELDKLVWERLEQNSALQK